MSCKETALEAEADRQAKAERHMTLTNQTACTDVTFATETVSPVVDFTEQAKLLQKSECPRQPIDVFHYPLFNCDGPRPSKVRFEQFGLILRNIYESMTRELIL